MRKRTWTRRLGWVVGFIVAAVIVAACNAGGGSSSPPAQHTSHASPVTHRHHVTPSPAPSPTPTFSVAQENAIRAAKGYLQFQAFSKWGLIRQLHSKYGDGYSKRVARFAVNHLNVDWNAQALRSAKSYLKMQPFSRSGLIQQLHSKYGEGFTLAQATYAANHVGL